MDKKNVVFIILFVVLGFSSLAFAVTSESVQIKVKYGANCEVMRKCDGMMYVDCGAAEDGPAYYLDKNLEVIGTSGGLCMGGNCTGAPKEWVECDGRQSDGPAPLKLQMNDE